MMLFAIIGLTENRKNNLSTFGDSKRTVRIYLAVIYSTKQRLIAQKCAGRHVHSILSRCRVSADGVSSSAAVTLTDWNTLAICRLSPIRIPLTIDRKNRVVLTVNKHAFLRIGCTNAELESASWLKSRIPQDATQERSTYEIPVHEVTSTPALVQPALS